MSNGPVLSSSKIVYGKDDALFGCIERQQGDRPFGKMLDAGTGTHSLRWIASLYALGMTSFTAITADANMKRNVEQEARSLGLSLSLSSSSDTTSATDQDEIMTENNGNHVVIGNWFGSLPLPHKRYDTILADYLIGALDGFSPYKQELMIPRLLELLNPGGRLYIVGLEPIPDKVDGDANVICKVRATRDACILLAGHRCYREFPLEWVITQVRNLAGQAKLLDTHRFPILYRHPTIVRQINVGRSKLSFFPNQDLAAGMRKTLDDLEQESLEATKRSSTLKLGFDYVVSIEKL